MNEKAEFPVVQGEEEQSVKRALTRSWDGMGIKCH